MPLEFEPLLRSFFATPKQSIYLEDGASAYAGWDGDQVASATAA